ncbi:hypothetical protein C8Q74DRAFT_1209587, partial [Fomes fomentarius]
SVIRKLGEGIQPLEDRVLLQLINAAGKTSTLVEDALLVVGALSVALEQCFAPYIPEFLPHLYPALKALSSSQST